MPPSWKIIFVNYIPNQEWYSSWNAGNAAILENHISCLARCLKTGSSGHCRHFGNYFSVWVLSLERFSYWKTSSNVQLLYNVQCYTLPPFDKFYLQFSNVHFRHLGLYTSSLYIVFGSKRTSFANPNKSGERAFHLFDLLQCHRQPFPGPGHGHRQLQVRYKKPVLLFICLIRCSVIGNLFLALVTATVSFRLDTRNKQCNSLLFFPFRQCRTT